MTEETLHPELERAGSFEHLPLGRRAVFHDPRTLRLASYLDDDVLLPAIPDAFDLSGVASWPMYGNDRLGDCTCAAAGHMVQAWTSAAGDPRAPADADVLDLYWALGSADDGRFEVDVLNRWRNVGLGPDRIAAYAYVNPQNLDHVRAAIYLFGGVYAGVALPNSAKSQQVWDAVGDPHAPGDAQAGSWGGHAVPFTAYGGGRLRCVTWGATLDLTDAFHLAYTDELYALISPDWVGAAQGGRTPAGFDLAALEADLATLTAWQPPVPDEPTPPPGDGFTWNG